MKTVMKIKPINWTDSEVTCLQKTGTQHDNCEDVVYLRETEKMRFFGVADGQSGKLFCSVGANAILNKVADYIEKHGVTKLSKRPVDELQYELIRVIRKSLNTLSVKYQKPITEFASTLIIFAYDHEGQYMLIHLGDGAAIGVDRENRIRLLSTPENGITNQYTYLTSSAGAMYHLRVSFDTINSLRRILLITDGTTSIFRGRWITQRSTDVIKDENRERLREFFTENNRSADDATCLMVDF